MELGSELRETDEDEHLNRGGLVRVERIGLTRLE